MHQIRREKRTKMPEVIVRGERNFKQNRNWFHFSFSVESSSFILNNFKTEKFKLTFKGSNRPVCKLFGFIIVLGLFVSIIVAKYNIFPRADNGRSAHTKNKKFWRSDLLRPSACACTIEILSTLMRTLMRNC